MANAPSKLYIDLVSDYLITLLQGNCGYSLVIMLFKRVPTRSRDLLCIRYASSTMCLFLSLSFTNSRNDRIFTLSFLFFILIICNFGGDSFYKFVLRIRYVFIILCRINLLGYYSSLQVATSEEAGLYIIVERGLFQIEQQV